MMLRLSLPALLVLLALLLASPADALVNGFEGGDGDQSCSAAVDWTCLPSGVSLRPAPDGTGSADVVFAGGKETEPAGWTFGTGGTGDKTDLLAAWSATAETATDAYLYLSFSRARGEGNAFFSFELNQVHADWTNPQGAKVPCRTDGDVLVSYEIPSTTSDPVAIKLYRWDGAGGPAGCPDGATGAWSGGASPAAHESALNDADIPNSLPGAPATLADATFGEAALDLDAVVTQVGITKPCEYFTRLQAHSRSSVSLSSSMGDFADGGGISVVACADPGPGPDTQAPGAPQIGADDGCHAGGTVLLGGIAEAGSQVEVRELLGAAQPGRGLVTADPVTGEWTLELKNVSQGTHTYRAQARDAAGNTSADSLDATASVDTTAPAKPVVTSPADGARVAPGAVELRGTAQPGATVSVREGATVLGAVTAAADGAWALTVTAAAGEHAYLVTAADACAAGEAARAAFVAAGPDGGTPDGPGSPGSPGSPDGGLPGAGGSGSGGDRIQVLPQVVSGGCTRKPFTLYLPGRGIRSASFRVDRREVRFSDRKDAKGRFAWRIDPRRFRAGRHKTSARLVLAGGKKVTVPMRSFSACVVGGCVSRRSFPIRVRKVRGDVVLSAKVFVNGKRVKVVRGRRLRARVELRGLPRGKVHVRIVSKLGSGLRDVDERTYRTCAKKKKKRP